MESELNIATYNCQGFKSSEPHIRDLLSQVHILALQETWLCSDELNKPNNLHKDFVSFSVSAVDDTQVLRRGRPYGGLTFLWHRSLSTYISVGNAEDPRVMSITYKDERHSMLLVNVYLPTNSRENSDEQALCLGKLAAIIDNAQEQNVCIVGDFNAAPGTEYYEDIQHMCSERDMVIADVRALPPSTFTHVNHGCLSRTWLDHVVLSPCLYSVMDECTILYNSVTSDHFPLLVGLKVTGLPALAHVRQACESRVKWNFEDAAKREEYGRVVTELLRGVDIDPVRVCCFQHNCQNGTHHGEIDRLHSAVVECMMLAGKTVFGTGRRKWRQTPGWNEFVREAHSAARVSFLEWRANGGPRWGPLAEEMRRTRARFKLCLRWCRAHEEELKAQALGAKLARGSTTDFWRSLRAINPDSRKLPLRVDQAVGEEGIAAMWGEHFRGILNCVKDEGNESALRSEMNEVPLEGFRSVTHSEMRDILRGLSNSEALGVDGLPSGAFKHAPPSLVSWLCLLINACICHQYIPRQVLAVQIMPLLKSKVKDPANSGNYRPIAIATALSKVIEKAVLHRLEAYLCTLDNQFSYKKGHGTEMCVWSLKNIIQYYTSRGSPVYLCFLDASKAFDRVNYWKLFRKLLIRGTPGYIVKLLMYWYTTQEFVVKWGAATSLPFKTANGIRQGGILSPYLYNVYTDDLSAALRDTKVGCHIHDECINSLSYADDMVLLAPTLDALQRLIGVCEVYAARHDIVYNTTKTECMVVPPAHSKVTYRKSAWLSGCALAFVDRFTYLGHVINQAMTDDDDIKKQTTKLLVTGNTLLRRFSFCSKEVKLALFRSHCYSLYCNSLWSRYKVASISRLRVCHNDILKRLLGLPRWTSSSRAFTEHGVSCLDVLRRHSVYSMRGRVERSENSIITSVRRSSAHVCGSIRREWVGLLYV